LLYSKLEIEGQGILGTGIDPVRPRLYDWTGADAAAAHPLRARGVRLLGKRDRVAIRIGNLHVTTPFE
jgi:hypothetical protein